jgi:transposase
MTKSPQPKPDPSCLGKYLPKKSAAKVGLAQKILNVAWTQIACFIFYKAAHAEKIVIKGSPHYLSQ